MKRLLYAFGILLLVSPLLSQTTASQRATTIGKGMCISWLDRYWLGDSAVGNINYFDFNLLPKRKNDVKIMKSMGVKTLRLPIWFHGWYDSGSNPLPKVGDRYFAVVDSFIKWATEQDMNLIIDYHNGSLKQNNLNTEGVRIANIWQKLAARYKYANPNRVFFEIYNEPQGMTTPEWMIVAKKITDAIRTVTATHTLIVGPANFNDVSEIGVLSPLSDPNIIYTFHFYDPFIFTHQGAIWVNRGAPVATTGIPFPANATTMPPLNDRAKGTFGEIAYNNYPKQGTVAQLSLALNKVTQWQALNNRPVICGEMGSSAIFADEASRCRHLKAIRQVLEALKLSFCWWDYDGEFRLFNSSTPSLAALSSCIKEAWGMTVSVPPPPPVDTTSKKDLKKDLAISITASSLSPLMYSIVQTTISVKNNGASAFTNINVECKFPQGIVNGGSDKPSIGTWREWCVGGIKCFTWSIPRLEGNATATLSLPFFVINDPSTMVINPRLLSSSPLDSKTANNQASITLTTGTKPIKKNKGNLQAIKPTQLIPIVIENIAPNPSEGEMIVSLESMVDKDIAFDIFNSTGKKVFTEKQKVKIGKNDLFFDVSHLPQGLYFIIPDSKLAHDTPVKFVKM